MAIDQNWFKQEWRVMSAASDGVDHPLAEELVIETCLIALNPILLGRVKALHTVDRELVTVQSTGLDFLALSQLYPGATVTLNLLGRFGYDALKQMTVVGIMINYVDESVQLSLWG